MAPAGAAKSVAPLAEALTDESPDVRRTAASALVRCGPQAVGALAALRDALKSKDDRLRLEAARALGAIGVAAKPAGPSLVALLRDDLVDVRAAAAAALGRIGRIDPVAKKALVSLLDDEDPAVQEAAATALLAEEEGKKDGVKEKGGELKKLPPTTTRISYQSSRHSRRSFRRGDLVQQFLRRFHDALALRDTCCSPGTSPCVPAAASSAAPHFGHVSVTSTAGTSFFGGGGGQVQLLPQLVRDRLVVPALRVGRAAEERPARPALHRHRPAALLALRCPTSAGSTGLPSASTSLAFLHSGSRCRPGTARAGPRAAPSACRTSRRCIPSAWP